MTKPNRTVKRQHLFTVRMLDASAEYICHREHIEGLKGVAAYKQEVAATSRRVSYVRIFNETTGRTRYEGLPQQEWPAGYAKAVKA